jgi:tetratricopeptide (TPR) repeat protein
VRRYVYKAPSDGYKKLEEADSLDLACEALVADADKPYAHLFTETDRAAASQRLAPHREAIERRKAATRRRIDVRRSELPDDIDEIRALAARTTDPEDAIAINTAIVERAPDDVVAMNRLGGAYEAIGAAERAAQTFRQVLTVDPSNAIATRRLADVLRPAALSHAHRTRHR